MDLGFGNKRKGRYVGVFCKAHAEGGTCEGVACKSVRKVGFVAGCCGEGERDEMRVDLAGFGVGWVRVGNLRGEVGVL